MTVLEPMTNRWAEPGKPLGFWYRNNNGLADGKTLVIRRDCAYYVCYAQGAGIVLRSGNNAFGNDVIGILEYREHYSGKIDPCHYVPLRRFRISPQTRGEVMMVNGQALFKKDTSIHIVDGREELTFRITDC